MALTTDGLNDVEKERRKFFTDVARAPLHRVADIVDNFPHISAREAEDLKARADALLSERLAAHDARLKDQIKTVEGQVDAAHDEVKELRNAFHTLAEEGRSGLDAQTYTERHKRLERRLRQAQNRLSDAESRAETLAEREDDPMGYALAFERRFPAVAQTLSGPVTPPAARAPRHTEGTLPPDTGELWDAGLYPPHPDNFHANY